MVIGSALNETSVIEKLNFKFYFILVSLSSPMSLYCTVQLQIFCMAINMRLSSMSFCGLPYFLESVSFGVIFMFS